VNNIGVFIPIRLGSERLPGKAMMPVLGKPIVQHLLDRILASSVIADIQQIVVCTTKHHTNDILCEYIEEQGAKCFRGSENDIIKRFYNANEKFQYQHILQIDGDDPLIPPEFIDQVVEHLLKMRVENAVAVTEGLPFGLNIKAFSKNALSEVYDKYLTENNDTGFGLYFLDDSLCNVDRLKFHFDEPFQEKMRVTLDYAEDLTVIETVLNELYTDPKKNYSLSRLFRVFEKFPELTDVNHFRMSENNKRTKEKIDLEYQKGNSVGKIDYC
jgi:spore coat polysaccharide biosynthesis protein SpsF